MHIQNVTLVYFSPTGTTRKVLEAIARGLAADQVESIDLTRPDPRHHPEPPLVPPDLVLLGTPVYGGRVPEDAVRRIRSLDANNALAVPVVVYGNRAFDDALLELKDLAAELGFRPVAAAAFIGEHSFATEAIPIANGRPDRFDLQKALAFGESLRNRVSGLSCQESVADLQVPGRFPYEGGALSLDVAPVTDEKACTVCGICPDVCPTGAISINGSVATSPSLCIRCSACIKECPEEARFWQDGMMDKIMTWLHEECQERREPEFFGLER